MREDELQDIEDMINGKALLNEDEINTWLRKYVEQLIAEVRYLATLPVNQKDNMTKITKDEFSVLDSIFELGHGGAFSAKDASADSQTIASMERKGILLKSDWKLVDNDEKLYVVNPTVAKMAKDWNK